MKTALPLLGLAFAATLLALPAPAFAGVEVKTSEKGITYSIRMPQDYDRAKGAILVIGFHGRGGNNKNFMDALNQYDCLKSAIVVTPNAPGNAMWETNDVPVISDLIQELQRVHHPPRTIACGFSAGGYFTFGLAMARPERIDAAVPMSGGLPASLTNPEGTKKVAFYVIHGDADDVVKVEQSRTAVKTFEQAGIPKLKYDEIPGLKHAMDADAIKRAFEWIEKTLGPAIPQITDQEAHEKLKATEQALKAKNWDAARKGFEGLVGAPRSFNGKIINLAKGQIAAQDQDLVVSVIDLLGRLGEDGVGTLRTVSTTNERYALAAVDALVRTGAATAGDAILLFVKAKSDTIGVAAAKALVDLGGDGAIKALIQGLSYAEGQKGMTDRQNEINASLAKLTGQKFTTSKDWKHWAEKK